jgi:hypothetical protein
MSFIRQRLHHRIIHCCALLLVAAVGLGCATSGGGLMAERGQPGLRDAGEGVYVLDPAGVDALLSLEDYPDLRVLVLTGEAPATLSDAHLEFVRQWVSQGGVAWIEGPFLESTALNRIVPSVRVDEYEYHKAATGDRGGELIVRDAIDRLEIADHPLTEGIDRLYIHPAYRFDGTMSATPIVSMTDIEGNHGIVIAAVDVGDGLVILDGTARQDRVFGGMAGFDADHPNAVRQGGSWNSYDWERLLENARRISSPPTAGSDRLD